MAANHLDLRADSEETVRPGPRLNAAVITDSPAVPATGSPSLEWVWPDVDRMLTRMLRRQGASRHECEDIVQETAARVVATGIPYVDADDLFRWASTVARRVLIDMRRKDTKLDDAPPPERSYGDVHSAIESRLTLDAIHDALPKLSSQDRDAILSGLDTDQGSGSLSRKEAVRLNVQRHRARERLRLLLGGLAGVLGWCWRRRPHTKTTVTAFAAVPVLCVTLAFTLPSVGRDNPGRLEPSSTTRDTASAPEPATVRAGREWVPSEKVQQQPVEIPHPRVTARSGPGAVTPVAELKPPAGDPVWVAQRERRANDPLVCVMVDYRNVACVDQPQVDGASPPDPPLLP